MDCKTGRLVSAASLGLANPLCERENCVPKDCKSVQDFKLIN